MEFKDFWYVVAESKKLKEGQVLGRKVLGEWLAVFRDETGVPVALQDRCLHRSAQISKGRLQDGKLTCPYHGWTYNGRGEVAQIPSEGPDGHIKYKRCAKRFAIMEKDDFVYVRLTDRPTEELRPFDIPHYREKGGIL